MLNLCCFMTFWIKWHKANVLPNCLLLQQQQKKEFTFQIIVNMIFTHLIAKKNSRITYLIRVSTRARVRE